MPHAPPCPATTRPATISIAHADEQTQSKRKFFDMDERAITSTTDDKYNSDFTRAQVDDDLANAKQRLVLTPELAPDVQKLFGWEELPLRGMQCNFQHELAMPLVCSRPPNPAPPCAMPGTCPCPCAHPHPLPLAAPGQRPG